MYKNISQICKTNGNQTSLMKRVKFAEMNIINNRHSLLLHNVYPVRRNFLSMFQSTTAQCISRTEKLTFHFLVYYCTMYITYGETYFSFSSLLLHNVYPIRRNFLFIFQSTTAQCISRTEILTFHFLVYALTFQNMLCIVQLYL